jgi:hypothetical protein
MRRCILAGLAAVALLLGGVSERALAGSVPVFTISDTKGDPHINGQFTLGWSFHTNAQVVVDKLGVFDDSQDGLISSHMVGIFDKDGGLVPDAETSIAGGDRVPLINQFRYQALARPVTLAAGQDYTIGALYTVEDGTKDDFRVTNAKDFKIIPQLTFGKTLYAAGDILMAPDTEQNTSPGFFGPNFTVAPEPSSLTLLSLAALGLGGYTWRRRTQAVGAAS